MKTQKLVDAIKAIFYSYKMGIETPREIIGYRINKLFVGRKKATEIKRQKQYECIKEKYLKNEILDFNGIKLPEYHPKSFLLAHIYLDSFFIYCNYNDNYDSKLVDKLDWALPEGPYGYKNDKIDVRVKKRDIVIDAGAWIGDFSAYASVKGAKVYAFEPSKATIDYLKITQQLNENIHIIEKGLGNKQEVSYLAINDADSAGYRITDNSINSEKIEITTIDDFVAEQKLEKVDFIKADIEGFERYMLEGAKETLKKFAPKLAICTYHLPDDPQVLAKIILDANPNYIIVQKRNKLYAAIK